MRAPHEYANMKEKKSLKSWSPPKRNCCGMKGTPHKEAQLKKMAKKVNEQPDCRNAPHNQLKRRHSQSQKKESGLRIACQIQDQGGGAPPKSQEGKMRAQPTK
jgi:hypothetical protein